MQGATPAFSPIRTTRSGVQFSPNELDSLTVNGIKFGVIRTNVSLDRLLREALVATDGRAADLDAGAAVGDEDMDEWEDEVDLESRPPTPLSDTSSPLSSPPLSPAGSPQPSPTPSRPPTPSSSRHPPPMPSSSRHLPPMPSSSRHPPPMPPSSRPAPTAAPGNIEKERKKQQAAARRRARCQRTAAAGPYARGPKPRGQAYREQSPHTAAYDAAELPSASGGAWVGRRSTERARRYFTLRELDEMGNEYIEWNGKDPKLVVDSEGRIVAILLGEPDDPEWAHVVAEAAKALRRARRSAMRAGIWRPGSSHRRGTYYSITAGVSFGGGQRRPGNLRNSRKTRKILRRLLRNKYIRRIVGFQSSGFALYAPKLYRYYCRVLKALFEHHPDLIHLFSNSIFPSATFNCGPDAFTFDHCDFLNLSHGLCGVTSGGEYDHKRGGHMYLKQLRLVIEFPSGASMLIPSGCVNHGNTPIQPDETRHSITQYAAGGLFRWAAYGYKSAKDLLVQSGGKSLKDAFDGVPGARWEWALGLFSKLDQLETDRTTAFASPL
ncbi:hypothetical protein B0H13DRAFT_2336660 [Mycena leptocephala]|nr:hypothetical protein B0H13DRAFT_2336660 [Mycena leptocephala]